MSGSRSLWHNVLQLQTYADRGEYQVSTTEAAGARPPSRLIGQKVLRPRAQVEEKVRSMIFSGELSGGEKLPAEGELARQFGVSRTTVREALRSLVTEGLLAKTPGIKGGSFVQSVDYQSLGVMLRDSLHHRLQLGCLRPDELAMVRQYLEVPASRLAAQHRSASDLAALREIVSRQKTISVDDPEVAELDSRFHRTIAAASGNRVLAAFVHALHSETEPVHHLALSPDVGRETVRQHQRIVKAIAAHDPDAAEAAVVEHLSYLREHLLPADANDGRAQVPLALADFGTGGHASGRSDGRSGADRSTA